ncbi:MAG: RES family NAD+ phosphorylase [Chloroflexi bacterium]|nr:RES family NAD+ phosphorylase [Chloroflexota bacterium]
MRGILYAAGSIPTALVEAFGRTRTIARSRDVPMIAGFRLASQAHLLDLTGSWSTHAGCCQAISSGRKDVLRDWARAIYESYDVDGLWHPSSMSGAVRSSGDPPLHGYAVAVRAWLPRAAGTPRPELPAQQSSTDRSAFASRRTLWIRVDRLTTTSRSPVFGDPGPLRGASRGRKSSDH